MGHLHLILQMDRNQAWPGEPPSQLASTSTHELFGSGAGGGNNGDEQDHYYGTDDTEQHEAIKKPARRNRNALSCAECRRLKLKCSRIWPCTVESLFRSPVPPTFPLFPPFPPFPHSSPPHLISF